VQLCLQPGHEHHCPDLSRVLYFNDGAADALDALAAAKPDTFDCCDTAADDVCLIAFTSGTTGAPKCIVHSQGGALLKHASEQLLHCETYCNLLW